MELLVVAYSVKDDESGQILMRDFTSKRAHLVVH
jgi:hypothetical protein